MPILLILLLLPASQLHATELAGRISNVISGNKIVLMTETRGRHALRLQGIRLKMDDQRMLRAAQQRLNGLIGGRFVRISSSGVRQSGELSGFVDWGGQEVNLTLVADGLARVVPEELDNQRRTLYQRSQAEAKQRGLGIWFKAGKRPPRSLFPQ